MDIKNPRYRSQGVHVLSAIFTVDKGVVKVLLIKRNNEPFKDYYGLVGGALYNDETVDVAIKREVFEKTAISEIHLEMFDVFSDVDRSPIFRMLAIGFLGIVDINSIKFIKHTEKTKDCDWFDVTQVDTLAYDHKKILNEALKVLKERIQSTDILKYLFPTGFTIPEIQKVYEALLNTTYDRRNFRKKLLSLGIIEDTGILKNFVGKKPAKVYKFIKNVNNRNIF